MNNYWLVDDCQRVIEDIISWIESKLANLLFPFYTDVENKIRDEIQNYFKEFPNDLKYGYEIKITILEIEYSNFNYYLKKIDFQKIKLN